MGFFSTLLIAISLSVDSFSVSIASSLCCSEKWNGRNYLFAVVLAVFQAGLFCLGWILAFHFQYLIESLDHWIAFGLLSMIGLNMIREGVVKLRNPNDERRYNPFTSWNVLLLAVGTSIDAMAVGIAYACTGQDWKAAYIIAIATLLFSALGLFLGQKLKRSIKFPVEIVGGVILIIIGVKILLEHTAWIN
ncbi:MAG: manganese efflux pump [Bacteroidota bacterium]|jgi:putative Mn2+ efflux pump MntP|nr:manganese efflux pump [Bacteroidota bacterium]HHU96034.1 hypothetical protein [Petrimonas sp.]